jgi:hypothetical protein
MERDRVSDKKTHYRKVFKSDHLSFADLEDFKEQGSNLVFTISHVSQERGAKVAGKNIDANIAYFKENIKPLVLNATNSKTMSKLAGSCFIENWQNIPVQLYIDSNIKFAGDVVSGVRISQTKVSAKPEITRNTPDMWKNAKAAYLRDGDFNAVLSRANISKANQQEIINECSSS